MSKPQNRFGKPEADCRFIFLTPHGRNATAICFSMREARVFNISEKGALCQGKSLPRFGIKYSNHSTDYRLKSTIFWQNDLLNTSGRSPHEKRNIPLPLGNWVSKTPFHAFPPGRKIGERISGGIAELGRKPSKAASAWFETFPIVYMMST